MSIIKKKRKDHEVILFRMKTKLNTIKVVIHNEKLS